MLVSKKPGIPNTSANQPKASTIQSNAIANKLSTRWWNIGRVGSPRLRVRVGHVDFMLFLSFALSFALGTKRKTSFR